MKKAQKNHRRELRLTGETIRELSVSQRAEVVGGESFGGCNSMVRYDTCVCVF